MRLKSIEIFITRKGSALGSIFTRLILLDTNITTPHDLFLKHPYIFIPIKTLLTRFAFAEQFETTVIAAPASRESSELLC